MSNIKPNLILLLIMLALVGNVVAATENHAGTNCVAQTGADVRYDHDGAVYNNSTTRSAHVFCNIPHTNFGTEFNPGRIIGGWMHTIDLNATQNISCRIHSLSVNPNGTKTYRFSNLATTAGSSRYRQNGIFGPVTGSWNSSYYLNCHLPKRTSSGSSRLYVYRIVQ